MDVEPGSELLIAQAAQTPLDAMRAVSWQLTDDELPLEKRLVAARHLEALFKRYGSTLKRVLETRHERILLRSISTWIGVSRHWTPNYDLEDRRTLRKFAEGDAAQALDREIAQLEPLAEVESHLDSVRNGVLLQLGAWFARHFRHDFKRNAWVQPYLQILADPLSDPREILRAVAVESVGPRTYELLESWHDSEQMSEGATAWSGSMDPFAHYWGCVLLLRTGLGASELPIEITLDNEYVIRQLREQLNGVSDDAGQWQWLWRTTASADELLQKLRVQLDGALDEIKRRRQDRIAQASLDENIIAEFKAANEKSADSGLMRTLFSAAGRIRRVPNEAAFGVIGREVSRLLPKEWFSAVEGSASYTAGDLGEGLARDQDALIYAALAEASRRVHADAEDPVARLVREIEGLNAVGNTVALFPDDRRLREQIFGLPTFEPRVDQTAFGSIAGVPIHAIPADQNAPLLLLSLSAVTLIEKALPGMQHQLWIQVRQIDEEEASRFAEEGFRFRDHPEWDDSMTVRELTRSRIVVVARLSYQLEIDDADLITRIDRQDESSAE